MTFFQGINHALIRQYERALIPILRETRYCPCCLMRGKLSGQENIEDGKHCEPQDDFMKGIVPSR